MSEVQSNTVDEFPRFVPVGRHVFDRVCVAQASFTDVDMALSVAVDLNADPLGFEVYDWELIEL